LLLPPRRFKLGPERPLLMELEKNVPMGWSRRPLPKCTLL
jgi:hypothetical protein